MHNAWLDGEGPLVDERKFTPWAEPGWHSWNMYSPELAFCVAAGTLASHVDGLVIETGAGQGYTTRSLSKSADSLHVYESDGRMRNLIPVSDDWVVMDADSPTADDIGNCALMVVDSSIDYRKREINNWCKYAPRNSLLLMHDAGNGHAERGGHFTHIRYWAVIQDLGLSGIKYKNPRGSFVGWKQTPTEKTMQVLERLLPN